jgi:hypothetical protein
MLIIEQIIEAINKKFNQLFHSLIYNMPIVKKKKVSTKIRREKRKICLKYKLLLLLLFYGLSFLYFNCVYYYFY